MLSVILSRQHGGMLLIWLVARSFDLIKCGYVRKSRSGRKLLFGWGRRLTAHVALLSGDTTLSGQGCQLSSSWFE